MSLDTFSHSLTPSPSFRLALWAALCFCLFTEQNNPDHFTNVHVHAPWQLKQYYCPHSLMNWCSNSPGFMCLHYKLLSVSPKMAEEYISNYAKECKTLEQCEWQRSSNWFAWKNMLNHVCFEKYFADWFLTLGSGRADWSITCNNKVLSKQAHQSQKLPLLS